MRIQSTQFGTMFSSQVGTGIPLAKTDVNRTMEILQEKQLSGARSWGFGVEGEPSMVREWHTQNYSPR